MIFVLFNPINEWLNPKKSRSMKKIYFLVLLAALTFQSALQERIFAAL